MGPSGLQPLNFYRGKSLARNRYGWQKRAKEMARKEKNDEKMKRRQGKAVSPAVKDLPEGIQELSLGGTDPAGLSLQEDS